MAQTETPMQRLAYQVIQEAARDLRAASRSFLGPGPLRLPKGVHECAGGREQVLARLTLETLDWLDNPASTFVDLVEHLDIDPESFRIRLRTKLRVDELREAALGRRRHEKPPPFSA